MVQKKEKHHTKQAKRKKNIMEPIATPIYADITRGQQQQQEEQQEEQEEEELADNQLGNECDNPKKFRIDHAIAKRERELRDERQNEIIDELAKKELRLKLNNDTTLFSAAKIHINKLKAELLTLIELEEMDERPNSIPNSETGLKDYVKPLVYEYFKVLSIRDCDDSTEKIFEVEDGDGIVFDLDFFIISGGRIDKRYAYTELYRKIQLVYRDASHYGAIFAVGKSQDIVIHDIYVMEKMPQHLLYEQKIDVLNDTHRPIVRATASIQIGRPIHVEINEY